uniref:CBF1-interacting co-repressor CIR N-terminal domain-containing protein n=1 Tax=Castor canadensis TaxID=51338 RepID=A0A8C0WZK0_CASCN
MNILPKKSWHVRNKDNVARVRRDEAQAREEEKERERRVLLAQQEARTEFLRKKARHHNSTELEAVESEAPSSGPVDLFRELLEEGKGVIRGNKEYEEEKRQEKERQEKALGILTYLGQNAAEAQTQPPWYQLPPGRGGTSPGPEKKQNRTAKQNRRPSQQKEQTEDRISELKEEMVIKGKTEELLVKQLKTCEKKMQELTDSIKRPNLRIMGIEEGAEVQAKGRRNIFNKIITENFPNLEKSIPIQTQEASRTPNRPDQNRTIPRHIITKTFP